ncbi:MrpF/PhaF family protein [Gleimia sp. 6138-11-ORH1]|uniref:MrpF/PhaF family protein n=1 Tax=Gleimia sp. 6138-11-ORH1 TaxID=2973937 RepID=UPI0021692007|nr:MrpF/PhaF family protein [Gleimia sp. 6138-11-ORH1]MCS4484703.1 MrpF/PhaF family protein [Gleimia sp. 6138-11-ORH1]
MLQVLYGATGVIILLTAILTLLRLAWGPSTLDRAVAVDVLTVTALAAVTLISILSQRSEVMIFVVILALTGFFSSVIVGRFVRGVDWHKDDSAGEEKHS